MSNTVSRSWPEQVARDELRLQWEFLDFLRATAVNKLAGLSREQAAATPLPSSPLFSALGVIKHLTSVERWWISLVGGGVQLPNAWDSPDRDIDFRLSEQDTPDSVVAAYQREWVLSRDALSGMAPEDLARREVHGQHRTVRWVLAHVCQETARHVGHLDVLRELADGQVGE
ncbi:DinB family protein [Kutzneria viridogrisea]|uniref:Mini-circle protein n=2 Tax=Kutzneria TaxID=43356 RepID=W5W963_9PSEU|nr:DinB family protein [Kutzneria albida]AHH97101.1 hypothetical protein KALB_3737 [Kutzneria albida DSM 43870]MBA8931927.1 putative damage-inducible protein DinB [Kutzneria viridogrisea]